MDCFIKKIFQGKADDSVHGQFTRFGKGQYIGKAILTLHRTTKVKLKGSYEYANDFVNLAASLEDIKFSGIVLSKEQLDLDNEKKKSGIFSYEVSIDSSKVKEISDKAYFMLLDGEGEGIKIKIKKKVPKPGKSGEGKVDDKFCKLEADFKYWASIKDIFFWDVPDCKKVKAVHNYLITGLKMPENEKDPVKIRMLTKRTGKLVRKLEIDKKEIVKECDLEV